jgi:putative ABC transport system permease protein
MFTQLFRFIAVLMAVVTLFSVANAVNMSISERVGEIGTLRALGFKQGHIRRVFQIEGALIGLLGAGLGVLGGALLAEYGINQAGWTWVPPGRSSPVPIGVDAWGQPLMLLGAVGLLTVLACASAWWPARRASKLQIVEALRHV